MDSTVTGNHEFDLGLSTYQERLTQSKYKTVVSNTNPQLNQTYKSHMFEVGGLKIGVIGLLTVNTPSTTATDLQGLQILEYNNITIMESNNLRNNGADLVILQCHVGTLSFSYITNRNVL